MTEPRICLVIFVLLMLVCGSFTSATELNTEMMKATVRVGGPNSRGTGFVLKLVLSDSPAISSWLLVTARHVLDSITGDYATVYLHTQLPDSTYIQEPLYVRIRNGASRRYLCHPDDSVDVAILPLDIPSKSAWEGLYDDWLLGDSAFDALALHPGDEVFSLGYPRWVGSPGGFAILRAARISSYPLVPIRKAKRFYLDMQVYKGCSGGPVYMQRIGGTDGSAWDMEREYTGIIGLISGEVVVAQDSSPLMVAIVQPSCYIRDILDYVKAQAASTLRPKRRTGQR
jgi:hypothetical protein